MANEPFRVPAQHTVTFGNVFQIGIVMHILLLLFIVGVVITSIEASGQYVQNRVLGR
jgi:hypothetical protein